MSVEFVADSEVGDFDLAGVCPQQITGLQVSMDDFLIMDCGEKQTLEALLAQHLRSLTVFKAKHDVPKGQPDLLFWHWIVRWHDENFALFEELKHCEKTKLF